MFVHRHRRKIFKHQRNIFTPDGERNRRHSYAGPAPPPREFFCPLSKCLMTEPVKLLNTGVTISRTGMQAWLRTGAPAHPSTCMAPSHTRCCLHVTLPLPAWVHQQ